MSISLAKGSTLSLKKADGSDLTLVRLGLGWDAKKSGLFGRVKDIDLDASAILFDKNKNRVDEVYYGHLTSRDGSIRHSGDNLTGDGDGDDEQIVVNLQLIPATVESVVLVITSYSGDSFDTIANVYARVNDVSNGDTEVARYNLADGGRNTASIVAKIVREGSGWKIVAVGNPANGKTVGDVISDAKAVL